MDDDIFTALPPEWWYGQEMSSAHDAASIKEFDLPNDYVLFAYPRDFTPVCTQELIELQKNLSQFPVEVIAASTDSPEAHNVFFNDQEYFPRSEVLNIDYPVLALKHHNLTVTGRNLILNEHGYCRRVALVVKSGKVVGLYEVDNDKQRDITTLAHLTRKVLGKA